MSDRAYDKTIRVNRSQVGVLRRSLELYHEDILKGNWNTVEAEILIGIKEQILNKL